MAAHIIMSPGIDPDDLRRMSEPGPFPRHSMAVLANRLGATVHIPHRERDKPNAFDRLKSRLTGAPETWALARRLASQLSKDDVVFCQSESVGFPLVALLGNGTRRPKVFVFVHNLGRLRGSVAAQLFRVASRAEAFGVCCSTQGEILHGKLGISKARIHLILEHVDNRFFTPGPASPNKLRPVIAGVGLEKRDYRTLAQASHDLDVDVRISGFSRYAALLAKSLPEPLPANMTQRFYTWPELVQLYRDADVVVAPVFPCAYAAGVTTLMEGMCCRRPIVVTRSPGLSDYLNPSEGLSIVEPADSTGMRQAIVELLADPDKSRHQADSGFRLGAQRYDFDQAVDRFAGLMRNLSS
jgi:glycosyltransferase involved in cell wall biosynthesis